MALISARKINNTEKIKLEISQEIYSAINKYCEWAGLASIDHFVEDSASYLFSKDAEWNKHLKKREKETS